MADAVPKGDVPLETFLADAYVRVRRISLAVQNADRESEAVSHV